MIAGMEKLTFSPLAKLRQSRENKVDVLSRCINRRNAFEMVMLIAIIRIEEKNNVSG